MSVGSGTAGFDLFVERDFLDAATLAEVFAAVRASGGGPATVYGRGDSGSVDERVRRTTRLAPPAETEELVRRLLLSRMGAAEGHFGRTLKEVEEPQFLRYGPGGYFVAHQDGNTGLLRSEREDRKVSAVVFLNSQAETSGPDAYRGGSLVFHPRGAGERLRLAGEAGTLVLFRAETTHEVEPVTGGERFTIASWYK
ncbi:MAG TPA: 2OG-Fe(II) oxygenase [Pyrinomonadaceae bacterium]|jgi:predicted 2-oxoglutarate/Fe(II)-dependent dioxygenase YbiX